MPFINIGQFPQKENWLAAFMQGAQPALNAYTAMKMQEMDPNFQLQKARMEAIQQEMGTASIPEEQEYAVLKQINPDITPEQIQAAKSNPMYQELSKAISDDLAQRMGLERPQYSQQPQPTIETERATTYRKPSIAEAFGIVARKEREASMLPEEREAARLGLTKVQEDIRASQATTRAREAETEAARYNIERARRFEQPEFEKLQEEVGAAKAQATYIKANTDKILQDIQLEPIKVEADNRYKNTMLELERIKIANDAKHQRASLGLQGAQLKAAQEQRMSDDDRQYGQVFLNNIGEANRSFTASAQKAISPVEKASIDASRLAYTSSLYTQWSMVAPKNESKVMAAQGVKSNFDSALSMYSSSTDPAVKTQYYNAANNIIESVAPLNPKAAEAMRARLQKLGPAPKTEPKRSGLVSTVVENPIKSAAGAAGAAYIGTKMLKKVLRRR